MSQLYLLWDESHIWGLLAAHAAASLGVPHRLVLASEIADGLLEKEPPSLLLVPGGNARQKAEALGSRGRDSVRAFLHNGGHYLGFCGGAGLALTTANKHEGLALCPWKRGRFDERMQHFMSGHLRMSLPDASDSREIKESAYSHLIPTNISSSPVLPVWWPGRFAPETDSGVDVLASYDSPADDFWIADLPLADLPPDIFSTWKDMYGVAFTPSFLGDQPCIIHGSYGKGRYILSYSHLETPDSPEANAWFAHLLRELGGISTKQTAVSPWPIGVHKDPQESGCLWQHRMLNQIEVALREVLEKGLAHNLLFLRNDWLMGWRSGLPGAALNNIWAALKIVRSREPGDKALACWERHKDALLEAVTLFNAACIQYLMAERLAQTIAKTLPETLSAGILKKQREALFGPPMQAGGLYKDIITPLDELAFLQLSGR